ncbi:MAG: histidinol-phosphate transaminase [Pseudomonadota bacterium]
MTHAIRPQPGNLDIDLYVPGDSSLAGANRTIKLSANENPLGPSPRATEAFRAEADGLATYPDGGHTRLRTAIGEVFDLDPARIICGNGSGDVIALLCQAYAGPGDEVIYSRHGFALYRIDALASGATPVEVPEQERQTDIDAILAAATERTRIVFIANPNNPTGTMVSGAEIARLAEGLPAETLLVLDGAYAEYVRTPGFDGGLALARGREDVVVTRTFSKIYGLGGLRIGWGYGPQHVIDTLNRIRGPFNVSAPALAAAEAAVRDVEYTEHCAVQNEVWRDWMVKEVRRIGLATDETFANFVTVRFTSPDAAKAADAALRARGVIVRGVAGYHMPEALRITVGEESACRLVIEVLSRFMDASR